MYMMNLKMFHKLLIVFIIALTFVNGDSEIVLNPTKSEDGLFQCRNNTFTILEGETVQIRGSAGIIDFSCRHKKIDSNFFKLGYVIVNVGHDWSGTWKCMIALKIGIALCTIRIHILLREAPHQILVDSVVLPSRRTPRIETEYDALAEHWFSEGDLVNITCVSLNTKNCRLNKMQYHTKFNYERFSDNYHQVGIRLRMGRENHNTHATCFCRTDDYISTVRVRFSMRPRPVVISTSTPVMKKDIPIVKTNPVLEETVKDDDSTTNATKLSITKTTVKTNSEKKGENIKNSVSDNSHLIIALEIGVGVFVTLTIALVVAVIYYRKKVNELLKPPPPIVQRPPLPHPKEDEYYVVPRSDESIQKDMAWIFQRIKLSENMIQLARSGIARETQTCLRAQ